MAIPLIVASIIVGLREFSLPAILGIPWYNVVVIQIIALLLQLASMVYFLHRFNKLQYIVYFPILRLLGIILGVIIKPAVMETLLAWSSENKKYTDEAFKSLRHLIRTRIDPLH